MIMMGVNHITTIGGVGAAGFSCGSMKRRIFIGYGFLAEWRR
jgi:hypothetical protein